MTTTKLNNITILDALSIRLIQDNFIISEDGSITVGYEIHLPVWGESSDSEITSMISSFKKALKALPD